MADIVTMAKEELKARGKADAAALAARAVSGEADGTELMASQVTIPTWRQRDYLQRASGDPLQVEWDRSTSCGSSTTPRSSRTGRPTGGEPVGHLPHHRPGHGHSLCRRPRARRGMYQTDECCTEDGHVWKCTQADTVLSRPPSCPGCLDGPGGR